MNTHQLHQEAKALVARIVSSETVIVSHPSAKVAGHVVTIARKPGTIHARCTCPWSINGAMCSHLLIALDALAARQGLSLRFWDTEADAVRQRRRRYSVQVSRAVVWVTVRSKSNNH